MSDSSQVVLEPAAQALLVRDEGVTRPQLYVSDGDHPAPSS
jgi:hypothetical protein